MQYIEYFTVLYSIYIAYYISVKPAYALSIATRKQMLIARLVPETRCSISHSQSQERVLYSVHRSLDSTLSPGSTTVTSSSCSCSSSPQFQFQIVGRHHMWRLLLLLLVLGSCCRRSTILISHKYFYDTAKQVCWQSTDPQRPPPHRTDVGD